jgi:hypothetical protein
MHFEHLQLPCHRDHLVIPNLEEETMKKIGIRTLVASLALLGSSVASAVPLASGDYSGSHESPGFFDVIVNSATTTTANLTFDLLGYLTLDGFNGTYTDLFTLIVNGQEVFYGMFNMGGGGLSVAGGAAPATWSTITNDCAGYCTGNPGQGGSTHVSLPISLVTGENKITFSYSSLANPQGTGDEGWGLARYSVTAVPEPETYAMLLAGLGMVGVIGRRRRKI